MLSNNEQDALFQNAKNYWHEKAKEHGAINCPSTQFEDVKINEITKADLLRGFPEERLSEAIVLDFGCGEGRMIPYIAPLVKRYIGVDASPSCLDYAEKVAESFPNVFLHELKHPYSLWDDTFPTAQLTEIDLFFSWTVFQHIPHKLMKCMIKSIAEGLREGAFAHIQFDWPTFGKLRELKYRFDQMPDSSCDCRWWPDWMLWSILESSGFDISEIPTTQFQCWRMVKK